MGQLFRTLFDGIKEGAIAAWYDMKSYICIMAIVLVVYQGFKAVKTSGINDQGQAINAIHGAQFAVYWKEFDSFTGTFDITLPAASDLTEANGWLNRNFQPQAGENGVFTRNASNTHPGIWVIRETSAPTNYDMLDPADGLGEVMYFVIITGGLDVTVNFPQLKEKNGEKAYREVYKAE